MTDNPLPQTQPQCRECGSPIGPVSKIESPSGYIHLGWSAKSLHWAVLAAQPSKAASVDARPDCEGECGFDVPHPHPDESVEDCVRCQHYAKDLVFYKGVVDNLTLGWREAHKHLNAAREYIANIRKLASESEDPELSDYMEKITGFLDAAQSSKCDGAASVVREGEK